MDDNDSFQRRWISMERLQQLGWLDSKFLAEFVLFEQDCTVKSDHYDNSQKYNRINDDEVSIEKSR